MEIIRLDIPDRLSIFQLPNTSTSKGYNLGDWKQQIWEGGLKIFETIDNKLVIRFYSRGDGKQFAQLQVPEKYDDAIVKCDDSVRGYALRLNNPKGGYTWIGLGFRDRNTAFDFRSRIIDFYERSQENTEDAKKEFEKIDDLSLKQGEKISFTMGGIAHKNANNEAHSQQQNLSSFNFGIPGSSQQPISANSGNNNNKTNTNDWGSWDAFGGQADKQQKKNDFFEDFSDFSNFGNTQAPQNPQQGQSQQGFSGFQQPQQNLMDEWAFGDNKNNNSSNTVGQQQAPIQTQPKPKVEGTTVNLLDL